ncbi:winged helix-turn-helix domain-containing protein [Streptomyces albidus (ex Kaewkla and Franco 2022)]|uniref:winged helix-turn-helix domain-containing protein n=1 Tax=Streptomyces albidus (ex Kaewkla and Franco 2022) TaxID=722709 RepID=UPI0015EF0CF9|nr:transcriptional regulator [Streptomyces albidus (ex Kaewkla and Franco 2022)]
MAQDGIDPLFVDPTRLSIMSLLAASRWAEFAFVRDTVGLSDSALSKQISKLQDRAYIEVERGYVGKRPRTWVRIGDAGRLALEGHVAALQNIVADSRHAAEAHGADAEGAEAPSG